MWAVPHACGTAHIVSQERARVSAFLVRWKTEKIRISQSEPDGLRPVIGDGRAGGQEHETLGETEVGWTSQPESALGSHTRLGRPATRARSRSASTRVREL